MRPFSPFSEQDTRRELTALMTVSSDPGTYGQLRVYTMSSPLPDGPALVATNVQQTFAAELTLLDQQGSRVSFGDLQILPVGDTIVSVRPWFVQAASTSPVPELRYVSVTYNKESFRGATLEQALSEAFPGLDLDLGSVVGGSTSNGSTGSGSSGSGSGSSGGGTTPSTTTPSTTTPQTDASVEDLLAEAQQKYDDAQQALKDGDLGEYQRLIDEAFAAARRAAELATGGPVTIAPSSGSGSASGDSGSTSTTTPPTTAAPSTSTPDTTLSA